MERAQTLLKRFIDEKLDGKLEKLADFDLEKLRLADYGDFGCGRKRFEYDTTALVNAVFVVLWHDFFKDSGLELNSDTVGIGKYGTKDFRGDTVHTTGAIAGYGWEAVKNLCRYTDAELEALQNQNRISRIGNMLLLPSFSMKRGKRNYVTINTFRGCHPQWRDYFDAFLWNLKDCLPLKKEFQPGEKVTLECLVNHAGNKIYFQQFRDFQEWIHIMMLDDCLDSATGEPFKFWSDLEYSKYPCYWKRRSGIDEAYIRYYREKFTSFLKMTKSFIDKRSARMINALAGKLMK